MDQAWEATKLFHKSGIKIAGTSLIVLSSDLKNATNAQDFRITRAILLGFIHGYGLVRPGFGQYVDLIVSMIGPRLISLAAFDTILSKKAVLMGEAIAKPSLTLLNLTVEELSFLQHVGQPQLIFLNDPAPHKRWRCCHIGGDDHLASGPLKYCTRITDNHRKSGSIISPGKHGYSRDLVKYTEKLLNVQNFGNGVKLNDYDYHKAIMVDSIKVRLLEKGLSTLLKKDNKNVAVGKSGQLARTIQWLPKMGYTRGFIDSIRNLFIIRMGILLPRKKSHPKAFANIHLPRILGGYELGNSDEYLAYAKASPKPTRLIIAKAMTGQSVRTELRLLAKLNSNVSVRGLRVQTNYEYAIIDHLEGFPQMLNAKTFNQLKDLNPGMDNRRIVSTARDSGWVTIDEFAKMVTRGTLFQRLLTQGPARPLIFQTRPWVQTYHRIWDDLMVRLKDQAEPDWAKLDSKSFQSLIYTMNRIFFIDIHMETSFDTGNPGSIEGEEETFDFREGQLLETFRLNYPSLLIGKFFLGLKNI
jgi:hypothetical protein